MARNRAPVIIAGLLSVSLALVGCAGTTSSSATAGVQGATQEASASASEPAASASASAASASASAGVQSSAEAVACDAIQAWSDEMRALGAMDPTTASADEVRAQVDKIRSTWQGIRVSLDNVDAVDEAAVEEAGKKLETGLDDFKTDVPMADAIAEVQTAAQPLKGVYDEMANGMGCTIENPY